MQAGFAKVRITPPHPVPLAGYFTLRNRMSAHELDPLHVRAIILQEGDVQVAILAFDLLLIDHELLAAVRERLEGTGLQLFLHATHTHSSMGGFGKPLIARLAFGSHQPWVHDYLAGRAAEAVCDALTDMQPTKVGAGCDRVPELAKNRRDPDGPVDDQLTVIRLVRRQDEALIVGYAGHPVIVAERDPHALSADFPGEICRKLELATGGFALYLNGPLGGVDVLFPEEPISAQRNLEMQARPIVEKTLALKDTFILEKGGLSYGSETVDFGPVDPDPYFQDQKVLKVIGSPLRRIARSLLSKAVSESAPVTAVRIGSGLLVGLPGEPGVNITEPIKHMAREMGLAFPHIASHVNGFAGYVHHPDDYRNKPPGSHLSMAVYENMLNIFGRDTGLQLIEKAGGVIGKL